LTNSSAHLFMSETYGNLPDRTQALSSELDQYFLYAPVNLNSFNNFSEYTSLFERPFKQLTVTAGGGNLEYGTATVRTQSGNERFAHTAFVDYFSRQGPRLDANEKVLDPACGTGGFLTAAIDHFSTQISGHSKADDKRKIESLIRGFEKKQLPHLLCTTNMLLHGIDVPSLGEQGVDVELTNWRGLVAPPGLTAEQRQALIDIVSEMTKGAAWQDTITRNRWEDTYLAGDEFSTFLTSETERIQQIADQLGIGA